MKPFIRRPEVEVDLARYARHIARDNETAAEAFVTAAENAFHRLAGLRTRPLPRPFSAWLVFYRETPTAIELVRVLHDATNLAARLLEPPES